MRMSLSMWRLWLGLGCLAVQSSARARTVTRYRGFKPQDLYTEKTYNSSQEWFTQQLDHFDPTDDSEWEQRCWVNEDLYRKGSPVFLYVAGEWAETGFSEDLSEHWEEMAVSHNALMFKLEHRFYGESLPTGDNLTTEDLQYLSSAQVLADLANFIVAMNRQYELPPGTRWVAFGCSYSATLAAWLRYKYPHLVYAAVASSAPLLLKINSPEYYNAVGETIVKFYGNVTHNNTMGRMCLEAFNQANKEVKELIKTPEGLNLTIDYFGLNDTIEIDLNDTLEEDDRVAAHVFNALFAYVSSAVQENRYIYTTETWGIERFCDTLLNETLGGLVNRYAEIYKTIYSESDTNDNATNRPWNYQLCAELGIFQTSEDENSVLGDYLKEKYYFEDCMEEFGKRFTEDYIRRRVDRTNTMYGGLDLAATRVLYVHGSLDPWFPLGMNRTRNPLSPVIVIEGASHCTDTMPRSDHDSPALITARADISHTLTEWLGPTATG